MALKYLHEIPVRFPTVYHNGKVQVPRYLQLCGKKLDLLFARSPIVVVVEPDFADRICSAFIRLMQHLFHISRFPFIAEIGRNANREENPGILETSL